MKPYSEAIKSTLQTFQPPKTELVLQHEQSFTILTACILAHLRNIAEPGSFNDHLNRLLVLNNLPPFQADQNEPSHKIFNIAELTKQVSSSQESLVNRMEEDTLLGLDRPQASAKELMELTQHHKKDDRETRAPMDPPTEHLLPPSRSLSVSYLGSRESLSERPHIPTRALASEFGLKVYTTKEDPYPDNPPNIMINSKIVDRKYKYQFTAPPTKEKEIENRIRNNTMVYSPTDLMVIDSGMFRKMRSGFKDRSPLPKRQEPRKLPKQ